MGIISPEFFMKAKKSLGQNFLIDKNIISKIVTEFSSCNNDLIIEIGPGQGALTKEIKKYNVKLICYEVDYDLKEVLNKLEDENTKIIWQDFLKSDISNDINDIKYNKLFIVGNLPYYIITPIIEHIMDSNINFEKFVIMVQKEVADRFLAKPHTKEYGYITVILNYFFRIKKIIDVSKYSFNPIPKVESTVLCLYLKKNKEKLDFYKYREFIKVCFNQKRKTLKNNLKMYDWDKIKRILIEHNLNENVRAEELSGDIFIELFKELF